DLSLLLALAVRPGDTHAGGDGILVYVQSCAALDDAIHAVAPFRMISLRRPEEPHRKESELRARSNSRGCLRVPRHTHIRASSTQPGRRRPAGRPNFNRHGPAVHRPMGD